VNPRRYLSLYAALWRNSVVREMGFKTNFLLWIVVELLWFTLQLAFVAVIYQHTERIGDWSKWEVVLLMGVAHFIQQVFKSYFLVNSVQKS
jgi:ABC-2 type transport system permease protein